MRELIDKLHNQGVLLQLVEGKLKIFSKDGKIESNLIEEIKSNKEALKNFLAKSKNLEGNPKAIQKIHKTVEADYYPVSSSQFRMWLASQVEESSIAYNVPNIYSFEGKLNISLLNKAFQETIKRHEILRTNFKNFDGEVKQFVRSFNEIGFSINNVDLRGEEERVNITPLLNEEMSYVFDLEKEMLLKSSVYQLEEEKWIFFFMNHHIISDGWSCNVLLKELLENYTALEKGKSFTREPLEIQYKDFATWQNNKLKDEVFKDYKEYWVNQFSGEIPKMDLPFSKSRPVLKTYNGKTVYKVINKETSKRFKSICLKEEGTLFMGLLAALKILLYKYSNQTDVIIGTPIAGRENQALHNQLGLYLNTLALRSGIRPRNSFTTFFKEVRETTLNAYNRQEYPFDKLIEELALETDLSRSPLFDVFMILQNTENLTVDKVGDNLTVDKLEVETNTSKFDLLFNFVEVNEEIQLSIVYNTDLFTTYFAEKITVHFEQLLNSIIDSPLNEIESYSIMDNVEKEQLSEFNDTKVENLVSSPLNILFERKVEQLGDAVALVHKNKEYSFNDLNNKANQLAYYLKEIKNIKSGDFVVVNLPRSEWMIITLIGILKSGATYIPVDPNYPEERIEFIVKDSQCKLVINEELIRGVESQLNKYSVENIPNVNTIDDLAYVIYTSGSTGVPKGCMLPHKGVVNRIDWMWNEYNYTSNDVILQKTTFTFDVSVWEIFMPLCWGTKMILCEKEDTYSPERLVDLIEKQNVSCLHFVPSMLHTFISSVSEKKNISDRLKSLRLVITSGEALLLNTVKEWYNMMPLIPIHNLYGPTEASIDVTHFTTSKQDKLIAIGKPIWNTQIYIVNNNKLQPIGVIGEICIGGVGLAKGYLKNEALTNEKFVNNPFVQGEKLYRTGDLGKWTPEGNVEFLGRKDFQVKIRGHRIELGEIETKLNNHPKIKNAVVLDHTNTKNVEKYLVGYIVSEEKLLKEEVSSWLASKLPSYMVPSYFNMVDEIPLTLNGKVDRKELKNKRGEYIDTFSEYIAPQSELEKKIAKIWEKVLGISKVGITEDFFMIGGNSLNANRLLNEINKEFNVKINLRNIFENRSIQHLAMLVTNTTENIFEEIPNISLSDGYNMSPSQKRFWLMSKLNENNVSFNMNKVFHFIGDLDISLFKQAFLYVIERHESLRTVFKPDTDNNIKQFINDFNKDIIDLRVDDLSSKNCTSKEIESSLQEVVNRPFNLSEGPLLRLTLFKLNEQEWLFSFVIHHIISDGLSMNILTKEFVSNYKKLIKGSEVELPELRIQYKDYTQWQLNKIGTESYSSQIEFWKEKLEGELPLLNLPEDKPRTQIKTYEGASEKFIIDKDTLSRFKEICKGESSTLFSGLLTIVKTLLYKYTGQDDIIIGTSMAGREHPDLEEQIGCYLNMVPLRTKLDIQDSFDVLLSKVNENVIQAQENQSVGLDNILTELDVKMDQNRSPLFDVFIVLRDNSIEKEGEELEIENLKITEKDDVNLGKSQFDLIFNFIESKGELIGELEYNSSLYYKDTICRIVSNLQTLITSVLNNLNEKVIILSSKFDKKESLLLNSFNDTKREYINYPNNIIELFVHQANKTPNQIALVFEEQRLTYQELDSISSKLSNYLVNNRRLKPNDSVGVKLEKNEWGIIALLGILKSRGIYVPIDIEYPEDRIEYIIEDSDCEFIIDIDEINDFKAVSKLYSDEVNNLQEIKKDDLAYIIYTSGSTGKPKGVQITHKAIKNTILSQIEIFENKNKEKALQMASFSFDASISEIFTVLASGGELHIISDELKKDTEEFQNYIEQHQINFATITPSYLKLLQLDKITSLNKLVTAGEAANAGDVLQYLNHGGTYFNAYGPTETSVCATIYKMKGNQKQNFSNIPIGGPIANTKIHILDVNENIVPIGVVGEIHIEGEGLSTGYVYNTELTDEKFISTAISNENKLYKTGDLGRWLSNGVIEYVGRNDDQVKVRGYRVELGEIEHALNQHEQIKDVVVVISESNLEIKEIVAFLITKSNVETNDIQKFLLGKIPTYMIPSHFIIVNEFPLTINGKIDKKKLLENKIRKENNINYVAPRNEIEEKMVLLWEEVLELDKIGVQDNFFTIGGHSLKAAYLISRIKSEFDLKLDLTTIFNNPTIEGVSKEIEKSLLVNSEVELNDDFENISI